MQEQIAQKNASFGADFFLFIDHSADRKCKKKFNLSFGNEYASILVDIELGGNFMSKRIRLLSLTLIVAMLISMMPAFSIAVSAAETKSISCQINSSDTNKVSVKVQTTSSVTASDGKLYLFAVPTYVDSLSGQKPIASVSYKGAGTYNFSAALKENTANSLLYSKFYVAVKSGSSYKAINSGSFITNPEVLADSNAARAETSSKKGVHIDFYAPTDLEDLGVKHTYFGIQYQDLLSNTKTKTSFTYNGKTYYIHDRIEEYDMLIRNMTRAGMSVSVGLLNSYRSGYEYMIHPGVSQKSGTVNYALNTSTAKGLEAAAAIHYFLASRYNGTNISYGRVENWIIGNEVNDNLKYYYMGAQNIKTFVAEYLQSFRVAYTAIKSAYSNANVYICLQHRWNTENTKTDYSGKQFIDLFNQYAKEQGNMDWGLAYHPYSFPMNDADILNDGTATIDQNGSATFGKEVTNAASTPIITMKNLNQLTSYFNQSALLSPDGEVRSIILSEQGYTSNSNITGQNEAKQAANIVLGYYIAEMNDNIDAFILRGTTDDDEGSKYFKFGLREEAGTDRPGEEKFSYEAYKQADTKNALESLQFVKAALNISDWSKAVPGWDESEFQSMGSWTEGTLQSVSGAAGVVQTITTYMNDQWEAGYNVFGFSTVDYDVVLQEDGFAVLNPYAYPLAWQGIEKHFSKPLNLSAANYLTMDVKLDPKDASGDKDKLELKVRLRSGDDIYDSTGIVAVNKNYTLSVDLRKWSGRNSIDTIEILNREADRKKSFDGLLYVYNVQAVSSISGAKNLQTTEAAKTDLSKAEVNYQKSFNYTGKAIEPEIVVRLGGKTLKQHQDYDVIYHNNVKSGTGKIVVVGIGSYTGYAAKQFTIQGDYPTVYNGVDYSLVYSYGYYKENNPAVVREVGDDPQKLLKHFATKGMDYALQGTGDFNVLAYAKFNDDLYRTYGENWKKYYLHYIQYGWKEGRAISGTKPSGMTAPVYPGSDVEEPVPDPKPTPDPTPNPDAGPHTHTYSNNVDGTCNICGIDRSTVEKRTVTHMFRMYNPNTGEHFYTGSDEEKNNLVKAGWKYEGVGFTFPANTGAPVYRLFQPSTGEHLYTMDETEKTKLLKKGWNYEGIAFNSAYDTEAKQHRLHNPNAVVGAYHFTFSDEEKTNLLKAGWESQGIGWYSCWK